MHENVCDRLGAATERRWQIRALLSFNLFVDHLSLQRQLFRDKKNLWGNILRKLDIHTQKQHIFGKLSGKILVHAKDPRILGLSDPRIIRS